MTITNHALTGAAIATLIKQPYLALPLAFSSHFLCDAAPHFSLHHISRSKLMWNYVLAEGLVMILIGTTLLLLGTKQPVWILLLAGIVAASPDIARYYYLKKGIDETNSMDLLTRFHINIQWSETEWGVILEFLWAGAMVYIILQ